MVKKKRNFSAEFRRETAELVLDNGYTHHEAAKAMGVDVSSAFIGICFVQGARRNSLSEVRSYLALNDLQIQFRLNKIDKSRNPLGNRRRLIVDSINLLPI
ncbi:transposase IS3/IS911 [Vibrio harveyi CAIM 1792]|nr:transposase IS3/IS911 [Vibrio harveyi CAIM 1792]